MLSESSSYSSDNDMHPPFLPLEETLYLNNSNSAVKNRSALSSSSSSHGVSSKSSSIMESSSRDSTPKKKRNKRRSTSTTTKAKISTTTNLIKNATTIIIKKMKDQLVGKKQLVRNGLCCIVFFIVYDLFVTDPEKRILSQQNADMFLQWVQNHPTLGLLAFLFAIAICVIIMLPIGTPLTLGCGYIYKNVYGWGFGVTIATLVSMGGSAIGAISCFLLGRYLMREQVREWIRKYPVFDAIDTASSEHGIRIMAMLYLTPILPLGPVSYMCGTTSMPLSSFVIAKIASLPLMSLYVFIGASMGELIPNIVEGNNVAAAAEAEAEMLGKNPYIILSGIVLSLTMISTITYFVKKELTQILERQKKHKLGEIDTDVEEGGNSGSNAGENNNETSEIESRVSAPRQRRRQNTADETTTNNTTTNNNDIEDSKK